MGGWTPGPWRIRENPRHSLDECDLSICGDIWVLADINGPQYEHQEANARLIASAPELLEAARQGLIAVEADIEEREGQNAELRLPNEGDPVLAVFWERADTIRAAILKATGSRAHGEDIDGRGE